MLLNSIIEILKTFDNAELKSFGKFVRSPYFNTNDRIAVLYDNIKKFHPDYGSSKLTRENLFKVLYKGKKFDDNTMRYLASELNKLLDRFLLLRYMERDELRNEKFIATEYLERKMLERAKKRFASIYEKAKKEMVGDDVYFRFESELLAALRSNMLTLNDKGIDKITRDTEPFIYYIISSLTHVYNMLSVERINNNAPIESYPEYNFVENFNIDGLLAFYEKPPVDPGNLTREDKINISMCISLHLAATLNNVKDEEHFLKLWKLVDKYSGIYSLSEQYNIYNSLDGCCISKVKNIDALKYRRVYLEIKKSALSKGLHSYKGNFMSVRNFRSIFHTAMDLREYKWAKGFAKRYIEEIYPDYRNDMTHFTKAEIEFAEGKYNRALEYISKVTFKYEGLKRFVKNLMLKIYYELDYVEQALSLIDSYKHFIAKNKKLSEEARMPNSNFLICYKDLLSIKINPDEYNLVLLKKRIAAVENVSSMNWLFAKVGELEKMVLK